MRDRLQIAVMADDITGAADTGVQFCPAVGPVYLTDAVAGDLSPGAIHTAGLSVFTNTRNIDATAAARVVRLAAEKISGLAPRAVYKKIDSCLRGRPGAEIDALLETIGAAASFVAPAFPGQGRITVDDCHRVNGIPVADTEIGRDPLCPVRESRLSVLLAAQSRFPVGHVALADIERGPGALIDRVRALLGQGCRHITFDAARTSHLDAIAGLVGSPFENILPVGSAGLAASLSRKLVRDAIPFAMAARPRITRWLLVCGSASRVLADQAAALARATGWTYIRLDPAAICGQGPADRDQQVAGLAGPWLTDGLIVGVKPVRESGPANDPRQVVRGLAAVAAALLRDGAPQGVFLSGGDTAEAFLHRVKAAAILVQEELLPGLMRGELRGGPFDGLPVVTKAGAFGQRHTLKQLIHSFG